MDVCKVQFSCQSVSCSDCEPDYLLCFICFSFIREKSTNALTGRTVRPAKKKAMFCLTEKSVDEEDMSNEEKAPPLPPPAQQSRTARSVNIVINGK